MFDGLEAGLVGVFDNLGLPLVGDALKDYTENETYFLTQVRELVLGKDVTPEGTDEDAPRIYEGGIGEVLGPAIAAGKSTIQVLQEEIFKAIGDILVTQQFNRELGRYVSVPPISTADLTLLKADLASSNTHVRTSAERLLVQKSKLVRLTLGPDFIQFNLLIGDNIFSEEVDLDFNASVPGLGLSIDSNVSVLFSMDYLFGIGFGFDATGGFYLDTAGVSPTGEEFSLDLSATLKGDVDPNTQAILPAKFTASLGFIGLDLTDMLPGSDPLDDGVPTGLFGSIDVDLKGGTSGRLHVSELRTVELEARLTAEANVDLRARLRLGDGTSQAFPSVSTLFHYDQIFADVVISTAGGFQATFGDAPSIVLENVSLDLGTFISTFAKPVLEQVQKITRPPQPLINIVTAPIPLISDLAKRPITFLDLAQTFGGPKFNRGLIDTIIAVVNLINSIPTNTETVMIGFGDFELSGRSGPFGSP